MSKEEPQISDDKNYFAGVNGWLARRQRIPVAEKIFFVQHLAIMVKAGISLAKALEMLAKQTTNKHFKFIIEDIYIQVNKGGTLADALKKYPRVFDELFANMVAAGEASGTLEAVLKNLHLQLKRNHQLGSKIRGALMYPAVILIAMSVIGVGMMIFVVPKFVSIFADAKIELPLMTRILIAVSNAFVNHGIVTAAILTAVVIGLIILLKKPAVKSGWHFLLLKLPIIGPIAKKINLARFARTMSALLKTDIKIVESFKITATTVSNVRYKKSLLEAAEKVKKGILINEVLADYPDLYNHVTRQMVAVGEETGELDTILEEIAGFYEEEVEEIMNTLPVLIEPIIIIALASVIGLMAVAIVMPMYSLTNAI
ncbi:MAG: type II secretion system F family protein [Patescibacteria group bacterium]